MKTHLVSFGTEHYVAPLERLKQSALPWFDEIHIMREHDLSAEFRKRHDKLLRYKRGFGFWVWKPWCILQTLRSIPRGDVLMYTDSQMIFMDDPAPLFDLCKKQMGILLFHQKRDKQINRKWTRRDTFIKMGCDEAKYWDGPQVNAAISVWFPTMEAFALLNAWSSWCADEQVISDSPSVMGPELPEFVDHRQDQSILSLLAIKMGLNTMPDPTQFGLGYVQVGRTYGQILESNRMVGRNYPVPDLGVST